MSAYSHTPSPKIISPRFRGTIALQSTSVIQLDSTPSSQIVCVLQDSLRSVSQTRTALEFKPLPCNIPFVPSNSHLTTPPLESISLPCKVHFVSFRSVKLPQTHGQLSSLQDSFRSVKLASDNTTPSSSTPFLRSLKLPQTRVRQHHFLEFISLPFIPSNSLKLASDNITPSSSSPYPSFCQTPSNSHPTTPLPRIRLPTLRSVKLPQTRVQQHSTCLVINPMSTNIETRDSASSSIQCQQTLRREMFCLIKQPSRP